MTRASQPPRVIAIRPRRRSNPLWNAEIASSSASGGLLAMTAEGHGVPPAY